jgi:hypothetical protein
MFIRVIVIGIEIFNNFATQIVINSNIKCERALLKPTCPSRSRVAHPPFWGGGSYKGDKIGNFQYIYRTLHLSILLNFLCVNYIHMRRDREILVLFALPNFYFPTKKRL